MGRGDSTAGGGSEAWPLTGRPEDQGLIDCQPAAPLQTLQTGIIFFLVFICWLCWVLVGACRIQFLTWDQTCTVFIGRIESQLLDHHRSPKTEINLNLLETSQGMKVSRPRAIVNLQLPPQDSLLEGGARSPSQGYRASPLPRMPVSYMLHCV